MVTVYNQPAFDLRLTTLAWPLTSTADGNYPIQRGFMYWDTSVGLPPGYGNPAYVRFLFNPSTITTTYVLQDSGAQASLNYSNAANNANLVVPLQQQCEFSLLFDRTYELWDSNNGGTPTAAGSLQDIDIIGVDVDVRAMRQFTGMYASNYTTNASTGSTQGTGIFATAGTATGVAGSLSQGLMQMIPSYLYFATPTSGVMYYGYVDSWDVIYTHWTSLMLPMRCEVDVSFTFLPPPQSPMSTAGPALIAAEQQGSAAAISQAALNAAAQQTIDNTIGAAAPVGGVGGR